MADDLVKDGFLGGPETPGSPTGGSAGGEDEGWLRTGGASLKEQERIRGEVVSMSESTGELGKRQSEVEQEDGDDDIPDMEDEEDDRDAIIREPYPTPSTSGTAAGGTKSRNQGFRTYTLYITYTPYYRTPRFYLSGYDGTTNTPLPPALMMQDIVGDYKDKTVTLEDFPFTDLGAKMASIHPCKHASVMKILLDRADAALKLRLRRMKDGQVRAGKGGQGMEGLIDDTKILRVGGKEAERRGHEAGVKAATGGAPGDEWEVLDQEEMKDDGEEEEKVAIRVDQYLVVFLKFMASVTPGIEHDFTMGV